MQLGDHRRPQQSLGKNHINASEKADNRKSELNKLLENPASKTGKLFVDMVPSIKVNYEEELKGEGNILSLNTLIQIANSIPILSKSASEDIIYECRNRNLKRISCHYTADR